VRPPAALAVAAANALGRVSGLARDIIFAQVFGAGAVSDAFNAAFRVPQLLRELFAEGSLQNVVVPAFAESVEKDGIDAAWKLANAVLGVLMVALGLATVGFFVGAELWVRLIANDFAQDAPKFALTVSLTRYLSPFLMGLSLAAFLGGLLNVRGRFFVPAMAQNVMNLGVIAACLAVGPGADQLPTGPGVPPIAWVALATTLSGFVQVALCVPPLLATGYRPLPSLRGHPALRRLGGFFATAMVGIVTVQFNLLVESQWAASFGDGVLTWLLGSFRLVQLPLALFAGSIATAMLPALAATLARRDEAEGGDILAEALRTHAFLVLPSAAGLFVLAEPLVRLFYERGAFMPDDTVGTANMLRMYALACFGICFHRLVVPAYYALGNPRFPMWLSVGAMLAKVPVVLLLTRGLGMGAEALPLSHALTVSGECVGLAAGLHALLGGRGLLGFHLRSLVATAVLAAIAYALRDRVPVLLAVAVSGMAYLVAARLLRAWSLPRRGPPPPPPGSLPAPSGV